MDKNCVGKDCSGKDCHEQNTTCDMLMDAAEELFAEKGYDGVSVRDITSKAQCNLAAVNYHFGSKEALYDKVIMRLVVLLRDHRVRPMTELLARDEVPTLEAVLFTFAEAFLHPPISRQRLHQFFRVMMHEWVNPRLDPKVFFQQMFEPMEKTFRSALLQACPELNEEQSKFCMHSIFGQLLHVMHHMIMPAHDGMEHQPSDIDRIIKHIVLFSKAGVEGYLLDNRED